MLVIDCKNDDKEPNKNEKINEDKKRDCVKWFIDHKMYSAVKFTNESYNNKFNAISLLLLELLFTMNDFLLN